MTTAITCPVRNFPSEYFVGILFSLSLSGLLCGPLSLSGLLHSPFLLTSPDFAVGTEQAGGRASQRPVKAGDENQALYSPFLPKPGSPGNFLCFLCGSMLPPKGQEQTCSQCQGLHRDADQCRVSPMRGQALSSIL